MQGGKVKIPRHKLSEFFFFFFFFNFTYTVSSLWFFYLKGWICYWETPKNDVLPEFSSCLSRPHTVIENKYLSSPYIAL